MRNKVVKHLVSVLLWGTVSAGTVFLTQIASANGEAGISSRDLVDAAIQAGLMFLATITAANMKPPSNNASPKNKPPEG